MKEKLFEIISKNKGYALFEKIEKLINDEIFIAEKEMAVIADNNLTSLMNIINNAGWDTKENHSKTIDIIRQSSKIYDIYLEGE